MGWIERERERESGKFVLSAKLHFDEIYGDLKKYRH